MPLYEYQCDACGHRFEVIQKFSDAPIEKCHRCEGLVRKLLSSPAIHFKGSGWYITDYARSGKTDGASNAEAPKSDAPGTSPSGESKTESKTETKTEIKSETKSDSKPATS